MYVEEGADAEEATLEIRLVNLAYGADAHAETFLEAFLDGNESHVGGLASVRRSSLSGVFVSGVAGDETYEAWIHSLDDEDDMGVAFVIRYRNDDQKYALYGILDTMNITLS